MLFHVSQVSIQDLLTHTAYSDTTLYSYVACAHDGKWLNGVVMEKMYDSSDCLVRFMKLEGPSASFRWPQKGDFFV
jgi:hypothetical protein